VGVSAIHCLLAWKPVANSRSVHEIPCVQPPDTSLSLYAIHHHRGGGGQIVYYCVFQNVSVDYLGTNGYTDGCVGSSSRTVYCAHSIFEFSHRAISNSRRVHSCHSRANDSELHLTREGQETDGETGQKQALEAQRSF
jgi:hypothetical protein